jgi:hypothetical protein
MIIMLVLYFISLINPCEMEITFRFLIEDLIAIQPLERSNWEVHHYVHKNMLLDVALT